MDLFFNIIVRKKMGYTRIIFLFEDRKNHIDEVLLLNGEIICKIVISLSLKIEN